MLMLSIQEKKLWNNLSKKVLEHKADSDGMISEIRFELQPAFQYFIGALLAAKERMEEAKKWFEAGMEKETVPANSYMLEFIERHGGRFTIPQITFSDPRPFVHFTEVPQIKTSREKFIKYCGHSLPKFNRPISIMDIGCGSGAFLVNMINHLRSIGKVNDIKEVLLLDPSSNMLELAKNNVSRIFPHAKIEVLNQRLEEVSGKISSKYDIALGILSIHHMPFEKKMIHMKNLSKSVDHFLIFEPHANHDTPELFSPELAVSVYQVFGRPTDFVLAHPGPKEIVRKCVDFFLMTEAISLLTQPRKIRTEYHMLRTQWHDLLKKSLPPEFTCLFDSTCYTDDYLEFIAIHYGR